MNHYIKSEGKSNPKRKINPFSKSEFLIGYALLIGTACYLQSGSVLFSSTNEGNKTWDTIMNQVRFDRYMKLYRFKELRQFLPKIHGLFIEKDYNPW